MPRRKTSPPNTSTTALHDEVRREGRARYEARRALSPEEYAAECEALARQPRIPLPPLPTPR